MSLERSKRLRILNGHPCLIEEDFIFRGRRCVVLGTDLGHRCGYIRLNEDDKRFAEGIHLHGGITFRQTSEFSPVRSRGEREWIGFDCNHYGDKTDPELRELLMPEKLRIIMDEMEKRIGDSSSLYGDDRTLWTTEMVKEECKDGVRQITDMYNEELNISKVVVRTVPI